MKDPESREVASIPEMMSEVVLQYPSTCTQVYQLVLTHTRALNKQDS